MFWNVSSLVVIVWAVESLLLSPTCMWRCQPNSICGALATCPDLLVSLSALHSHHVYYLQAFILCLPLCFCNHQSACWIWLILMLLVLGEAEELHCELLCLIVVCGPHAVCPCVRRSREVESATRGFLIFHGSEKCSWWEALQPFPLLTPLWLRDWLMFGNCDSSC